MPLLFLAELTKFKVQTDSYYKWATEDPTGRLVTVGVGIVLALIVLMVALRSMKWAAARWKTLMAVAVVLAGLAYGSIYVFNLGPIGWAVAAMVAFGMLIGFALFMTHTQR